MEDLVGKAKSLIGRELDVVTTGDGRFVVEWFNFNTPPPPIGNTREEALEKFIKFIEENPDGNKDTGDEESRAEVERADSPKG